VTVEGRWDGQTYGKLPITDAMGGWEVMGLSARLSSDLKAESANDGPDLSWSSWMAISMVKDDGQNEGPLMFLQGHPIVGEHYAAMTIHVNYVVVIVDEFFCLFARTNGNGLIRVDPVKVGWAGHIMLGCFRSRELYWLMKHVLSCKCPSECLKGRAKPISCHTCPGERCQGSSLSFFLKGLSELCGLCG